MVAGENIIGASAVLARSRIEDEGDDGWEGVHAPSGSCSGFDEETVKVAKGDGSAGVSGTDEAGTPVTAEGVMI
jgi:hypothetical protein